MAKTNVDPNSKEAAALVEAGALALSKYEQAILAAMDAHAAVQPAIHAFHLGINTHATYIPYDLIAQSLGKLGEAYGLIADAHKQLDALRKVKKFPRPSAEARNGSGGCKPHCFTDDEEAEESQA